MPRAGMGGDALSSSRLANLASQTIVEAFEAYEADFAALTRRAGGRFARCDWKGAVADAVERLDLYGRRIDEVERQVRLMLGERVTDRLVWTGAKAVYSGLIASRDDWELAETFFNSVTRRVFATVGVERNIEFVDSDFEAPQTGGGAALCRLYEPAPDTAKLVEAILVGSGLGVT